MGRKLLFIGVLLLGALPGFGQGRDTAFAVRKLFREKRAAAQGLQSAGSRETTDAKYVGHSPPTAQEARQDALGNTVFTTVGLLKAGHYSPENEAAVLRCYADGGGLPPEIRRKLRRKHFHRTAKDVMLGH